MKQCDTAIFMMRNDLRAAHTARSAQGVGKTAAAGSVGKNSSCCSGGSSAFRRIGERQWG